MVLSASTSGTLGQPLGDRGLANARLTDQQRIVLAPPAEDADHALDLEVAADQRVDASLAGLLVEIAGEALERRLAGLPLFALLVRFTRGTVAARALLVELGDAVREVVDDVEAGQVLAIEQEHRLRLLLGEQRHDDVGTDHLLLPGRLHLHHRPLQHASSGLVSSRNSSRSRRSRSRSTAQESNSSMTVGLLSSARS
jgi:hypothetical protein